MAVDYIPGKQEIIATAKTVLGPAAVEAGQLIANEVRFWNWRHANSIMRRAARIRRDSEVTADVPLKLFLPFIEEASKENDDNLQELWANLLATATSSSVGFDLVCINILKNIGYAEAKFLIRVRDGGDPGDQVRKYGMPPFSMEDIPSMDNQFMDVGCFPIYFHMGKYPTTGAPVGTHSNFYRENKREILTLLQNELVSIKREPLNIKVDNVDAPEWGLDTWAIEYISASELGREFVERCSGESGSVRK